eukprot:6190039-Pleurochrysis_carterae.AAC.1
MAFCGWVIHLVSHHGGCGEEADARIEADDSVDQIRCLSHQPGCALALPPSVPLCCARRTRQSSDAKRTHWPVCSHNMEI